MATNPQQSSRSERRLCATDFFSCIGLTLRVLGVVCVLHLCRRPCFGGCKAGFPLVRHLSAGTGPSSLYLQTEGIFNFRKLVIALHAAGYQGARTSLSRSFARGGDRREGCLQAVVSFRGAQVSRNTGKVCLRFSDQPFA